MVKNVKRSIQVDSLYERLLLEINNYEKEFRDWYFQCEKIITKYSEQQNTPDRTARGYKRYNIFWANVQTLLPNVYSRIPEVEVERMYKDNDPVSRVATILLERIISHCLKYNKQFHEAMNSCVLDRLLGGRGVVWLRYEPHNKAAMAPKTTMEEDGEYEYVDKYVSRDEVDGLSPTENKEEFNPAFNEQNKMEGLAIDYVHFEDFGHSYARIWTDIEMLWRVVFLNREQCIARFGEKGKEIPLDSLPSRLNSTTYGDPNAKEIVKQAKIYEIWDKSNKKVYWLNKSLGEILDTVDDPLNLEHFFPCPRPLYSTLSNNSLKPTPDYIYYRDLSDMLDSIVQKEDKLIEALQLKGVYDGAFPELKRLFTEADMGDLVGVKNWGAITEKGGLLSSFQLIELKPIYEAIATCNAQIEVLKQQIYDVTGISDILRGQSLEYETAAAQKLKSTNGNGRLKTRQMEIVDFATDIIKLASEVITTHFDPETIIEITNATSLEEADQMLVPQALQLIKDKLHMGFKIEVTSDSMVFTNQLQEREDRIEYMNVASGFMQQFVQSSLQTPELAPMMGEMIKFTLRPFKVGKVLEGVIDQTISNLIQKAMQLAQNPPPNPDIEKEKLKGEMEMQKLQLQLQHEAMMEDKDLQIEYAKVKLMERSEKEKLALATMVKEKEIALQVEKEKASQQLQLEESTERIRLEKERNIATEQAEIEKERIRVENEVRRDLMISAQKNITDIEKERIKLGLSDGELVMMQNLTVLESQGDVNINEFNKFLAEDRSKLKDYLDSNISKSMKEQMDRYQENNKKPSYKTVKDEKGRVVKVERVQ